MWRKINLTVTTLSCILVGATPAEGKRFHTMEAYYAHIKQHAEHRLARRSRHSPHDRRHRDDGVDTPARVHPEVWDVVRPGLIYPYATGTSVLDAYSGRWRWTHKPWKSDRTCDIGACYEP